MYPVVNMGETAKRLSTKYKDKLSDSYIQNQTQENVFIFSLFEVDFRDAWWRPPESEAWGQAVG